MILAIYYGLFALCAIGAGLVRKNPIVRYIGFFLVAMTLGKLAFYIVGLKATERIIAFVVVGVVLVLISFAYQYFAKKIEV